MKLTGNATLVRAWETLTGPIRVAILFAGPAAALANMSAARHQHLLDAIGSGDPDTARSAVDAHMREAARTLLASAAETILVTARNDRSLPIDDSIGQQSTDSAQHAMLG